MGERGDGGVRRRRSIISQLLVAFSVFAVLIAVAGVFGYLSVIRQYNAAQQQASRYQALADAQDKMGEAYGSGLALALSIGVTGDPVYRPIFAAKQAQFADGSSELLEGIPPSLRGLAETQVRSGQARFALDKQLMTIRQGTPQAKALLAKSAVLVQQFAAADGAVRARVQGLIKQQTASGNHELKTGLAWAGVALAVALLLVLAGSLSTLRTITGPLRALAGTVRRLTTGDHAARAAVSGSPEVREVAQAVNMQADEADRFRDQEAENNRLRAMARTAGIRIREPLTADAVIQEARTILEQNVDADVVYLHLITDERGRSPAGHEQDWVLANTSTTLPEEATGMLRDLFRNQASQMIQDVQDEEGELLAPWLRTPMRQAGIASHVVTPFGVGDELLGFIAAYRLRPGRRWTPAEIDAVESIAADLGRGLNHAQLYEAENRLVEGLKALDEAKTDFFATVSHELRAPLTSIEGYIELLSEEEAGPVTPEQRKMLQTAERNTSRLRNLIDDVFTLAKLESGEVAMVTRPVNLAEVISGAVDAVRPSVAAGQLALVSNSVDSDLVVDGDIGQLDRVLINLLSNAVKYTPPGGRIEVRAEAENGSALVRVSDTGMGIPAADQNKLFDRFYRASNARQQSAIPGTGLGLAIVRSIVTNHGGEISLASKETEGTTVTVRLPLMALVPG
jgi:two-component system, OmpR family, phosphate regulon sensor histidine kinase PhoR